MKKKVLSLIRWDSEFGLPLNWRLIATYFDESHQEVFETIRKDLEITTNDTAIDDHLQVEDATNEKSITVSLSSPIPKIKMDAAICRACESLRTNNAELVKMVNFQRPKLQVSSERNDELQSEVKD